MKRVSVLIFGVVAGLMLTQTSAVGNPLVAGQVSQKASNASKAMPSIELAAKKKNCKASQVKIASGNKVFNGSKCKVKVRVYYSVDAYFKDKSDMQWGRQGDYESSKNKTVSKILNPGKSLTIVAPKPQIDRYGSDGYLNVWNEGLYFKISDLDFDVSKVYK